MVTEILLYLSLSTGITMAEVDDCPILHYRNGTQCDVCSKCPRGFGVKENCSAERDTECEPCWPDYDYSDTNSFKRCIICDAYSNCIQGNHKKIKNCTIFSQPVCDGCAEENFFNPNIGMNGACVQCSPRCNPLEVETRPCKTAHDRTCTDKSLATIPISSNLPTGPSKEVPNSTNDDIKVHTEDPALAATTPLAKKLVVWISVGMGSTILVAAFVVALICRKTNNRRKRDVNARDPTTRGDTQQTTPLMSPQECGLDLPIKDLTIGGRRFIAKKLNGKYHDGYFHWQMTADKVGLHDECESWKNNSDNPAEKFLTAYGEKEGSTIRNLIKALRDPEVDLTQIAKEIEDKFSPPQVKGEPAEPIDQGGFELAELTYQGQPEDLMAQDEQAAGCVVHTYV